MSQTPKGLPTHSGQEIPFFMPLTTSKGGGSLWTLNLGCLNSVCFQIPANWLSYSSHLLHHAQGRPQLLTQRYFFLHLNTHILGLCEQVRPSPALGKELQGARSGVWQ